MGATSVSGAVDYSTVTPNANDATKQDVTYTFNNASSYSKTGVTVNSTVAATVFNGTTNTDIYQCSTEGLDRLAFHKASGASTSSGKWWWRFGSKYGLQLRESGKGGMAILNLKAGDVVTINLNNPGNYSFPGASSVDSTDQTPNKGEGEASYTVTTTTKAITINVTADGYVASYVAANSYGYITSIVITEAIPAAAKPSGEITKVNGIKRIVSLTSTTTDGVIYYTTDGTTPTASSNKYDAATGIEISDTTTINAVTIANGATSEVYTQTFAAGTEISLKAPDAKVTGMYPVDSDYYPTYTITSDNSSLLCAPTATMSATFNGGPVTLTDDNQYQFVSSGTLVVTASADGYASSSVSINFAGPYVLSKTIDIKGMTSSDVNTDCWTKNADETTTGQWLFKGVENYSLTAGADAEKAIDGLTLFTTGTPKLYIGYGLQQNALTVNYSSVKVTNGTDSQLVDWKFMNGYNSSIYEKYMAGTEAFSLYRFSWMVTGVDIYTLKNVATGINMMDIKNVENDKIYNMMGVQVINPTKGLFIKSGKKIIIK